MNEIILGIDLGATKTHIGAVKNCKIIDEFTFPTSANATKQQIIREIIGGIEKFSISGFSGIGIGVPGLIDEERGIVYDVNNIASWQEVHLKRELERQFKIPVKVTNDANVFILGEKVYGEGAMFKNLVGVTIGSGFGTGIIIDHKLYSGSYSSAGELGSIPYLDKTIEDYCSGKFFLDNYGLRGEEVSELAKTGDAAGLDMMNEYGKHLGKALNIVLYALSPEAIFLGGSISSSYKFFERSLQHSMLAFPFKKVLDKLVIKPSHTSNIAILGAAALLVSEKPVPEQLSKFKTNNIILSS